MAIAQLTEPTAEPVSDIEAADHLRVSDNLDAFIISSLIEAARQRAEANTGLAFISRSFGMYLDRFPSGEFRVPCAPLVSVESIKYYNASNVEVTLNATEYYVDSVSKPGRISPVTNWPGTFARPNAVSIVFTAGYGDATKVPRAIKQAMLLMIGDMYENREDANSPAATTAERLLQPFRVLGQ